MQALRRASTPFRTVRFRRRAAVVAAPLVLALTACGGDASQDKSRDELNFSRKSAQDAGLYTVRRAAPPGGRAPRYTSYTTVTDASGAISFEVPAEWADAAVEAEGDSFYQAEAAASPNLDAFSDGWSVPGVFVAVSRSLGASVAAALLPELVLPNVIAAVNPPADVLAECTTPARVGIKIHGLAVAGVNVFEEHIGDLVDEGIADIYSNCGGNGTQLVEITAYSRANSSVLHIEIQNVTQADVLATERLLSTLRIEYARVPQPTSAQTAPEFLLP